MLVALELQRRCRRVWVFASRRESEHSPHANTAHEIRSFRREIGQAHQSCARLLPELSLCDHTSHSAGPEPNPERAWDAAAFWILRDSHFPGLQYALHPCRWTSSPSIREVPMGVYSNTCLVRECTMLQKLECSITEIVKPGLATILLDVMGGTE